MITVHRIKDGSSIYSGYNYDGLRFGGIQLAESLTEYRPSSEFLRQGSVFDAYGNKAVRHDHWKGHVYPYSTNYPVTRIPSYGGWIVRPIAMIGTSSSTYRFIVNAGSYASWWKVTSTSAELNAMVCRKTPDGRTRLIAVHVSYNRRNKAVSSFCSDNWADAALDALVDKVIAPTPPASDGDWTSWTKQTFGTYLAAGVSLAFATLLQTGVKSGTTPAINFSTVDMSAIDNFFSNRSIECVYIWPSFKKSAQVREVIEHYNDFTSNGLAYLSDLSEVGSTIRTGLGLITGATKKDIRSIASAWLSLRYGDRLTVSDTRELLLALKKRLQYPRQTSLSRSRMTSYETSLVHGYPLVSKRVVTVVVRANSNTALMTAVNRLMNWDIWPTLENVWDLVPFSFVVDWFLSVSDVLNQIDAAVQAPYLRPITQYASERTEMTVQAHVNTVGIVNATFVRYARGKHNVLGDIRPFENVNSVPTFSVVNVLDAGALLLQSV